MIRSTAWIFTASAALAVGCSGGAAAPEYRPVTLLESRDPLAPRKDFPAWKAPRQFAVWVHPHEDRDQELLVGGHWILVLLGRGSWYVREETDRDPLPDAEATREEIEAGLKALSVPGDAVIPYRKKEE